MTLLERIAEIEARAVKATEGPWTTQDPGRDENGWPKGVLIAATAPGKLNRVYATPPGGSFPAADQDFIAAARTDIPALCAAVRMLAEAVEARETARAVGIVGIDSYHPEHVPEGNLEAWERALAEDEQAHDKALALIRGEEATGMSTDAHLARAARASYNRARASCAYQRDDPDSRCRSYIDRGRSICDECPVEWVSEIEDVLEEGGG